MYCIDCGTQIPDNSKFCSHCGKNQNEVEPSVKEKVVEATLEKESTTQVDEAHKSVFGYQFPSKFMGWYLAWILFNLLLLLVFSSDAFGGYNSDDGIKDFTPFNECNNCDFAEEYDITEFLVYTIFPLAILAIINLTKKGNADKVKNHL